MATFGGSATGGAPNGGPWGPTLGLPADPNYLLVSAAYNSVHALWIQTHYLSCEGAGRASGKEVEEG